MRIEIVVFDGYDLIVYGTVQSSLLAIDDWGLTPTTMGTIGSLASLRLPRLRLCQSSRRVGVICQRTVSA